MYKRTHVQTTQDKAASLRFPTVSDYFTYVKNKVVITFKRHPEHMPSKVGVVWLGRVYCAWMCLHTLFTYTVLPTCTQPPCITPPCTPFPTAFPLYHQAQSNPFTTKHNPTFQRNHSHTKNKHKIPPHFPHTPPKKQGGPDDGLQLELTTTMTYQQVTTLLAAELNLTDHQLLRLTQSNAYASDMPKTHPVKYAPQQSLLDMMTPTHGHRITVFYYETLDIPLPQLERLKSIKVRVGVVGVGGWCVQEERWGVVRDHVPDVYTWYTYMMIALM